MSLLQVDVPGYSSRVEAQTLATELLMGQDPGRLAPLELGALLNRLATRAQEDREAQRDVERIHSHIEAIGFADNWTQLLSANTEALVTTSEILRQVTPILDRYQKIEEQQAVTASEEVRYARQRQDNMSSLIRGVFAYPPVRYAAAGLASAFTTLIGVLVAWLTGLIQVASSAP